MQAPRTTLNPIKDLRTSRKRKTPEFLEYLQFTTHCALLLRHPRFVLLALEKLSHRHSRTLSRDLEGSTLTFYEMFYPLTHHSQSCVQNFNKQNTDPFAVITRITKFSHLLLKVGEIHPTHSPSTSSSRCQLSESSLLRRASLKISSMLLIRPNTLSDISAPSGNINFLCASAMLSSSSESPNA